jgi:basic amino acid/polyamine antiporter, APA family
MPNSSSQTLTRQIGLSAAVWLGLGAILGSGVFVAVPQATQMIGPLAIAALLCAGIIAICNGLSSAQLAAAHPVSGGTYEYGYRFLTPSLGRAAGWLFLCAKSASAAVAARAAVNTIIVGAGKGTELARQWEQPAATALVALFTAIVLIGIRRSTDLNRVLVIITTIGLGTFCVYALSRPAQPWNADDVPEFSMAQFGYATAFLFVAFTGYGRVATLGEEILEPRRNVPRAVIATLVVALSIYLLVAYSVVRLGTMPTAGTPVLTNLLAPDAPLLSRWLISIGVLAATCGVLLNLLLGLSRTAFAMARRHDLPPALAALRGTEPSRAVIFVGAIVAAFTWLETTKYIWSVSAASVLFYYALTNACALRLDREQRFLPRGLMWAGLVGCAAAAAAVPLSAWTIVAAVSAIGLLLSTISSRLTSS